eukprot:11226091-Lingulodinium_polyedra.AAC.1
MRAPRLRLQPLTGRRLPFLPRAPWPAAPAALPPPSPWCPKPSFPIRQERPPCAFGAGGRWRSGPADA